MIDWPRLDRVVFGVRSHRVGARLFRVVVGLALLFQLLIVYVQRSVVYGPDGVYPFELFADGFGVGHYSILALSAEPWFFQLVYHAAILVIFAWTCGVATRVTTPAVWYAIHCLHSRVPILWDGGDNLVHIVLIYACFMDLSPARTRDQHQRPGLRWVTLLHNAGWLACAVQVATVYFVAGLAKTAGEYWVNGTAFYYVLRSAEFGMTDLGPLIWNSPVLLCILTWSPLLLQLAFPWVYFLGRPEARRALVLAAISFHVGIFALMGLETFAAIMVGAELLLLSDADFRRLEELANSAWHRTRDCARRIARSRSSAPIDG